tara:strand:+ start:331 stop:831 length:501 start_codon:yes stop_codon:yes gene_type:complete
MGSFDLINGDCLEKLNNIDDGTIDLILADPPYGTTELKWDSIIPLEKMWFQLNRVIKKGGVIVFTTKQPFSSLIVSSNIDFFKYSLVWYKKGVNAGFAQAPYRFLNAHEDILVFSDGGTTKNAKIKMTYNPQGLKDVHKVVKGRKESSHRAGRKNKTIIYKKNGIS